MSTQPATLTTEAEELADEVARLKIHLRSILELAGALALSPGDTTHTTHVAGFNLLGRRAADALRTR